MRVREGERAYLVNGVRSVELEVFREKSWGDLREKMSYSYTNSKVGSKVYNFF